MSKKKSILKHIKTEARQWWGIRISKAEKDQITKLAKRFAGGNASEWTRHAALNYKPSPKDLA